MTMVVTVCAPLYFCTIKCMIILTNYRISKHLQIIELTTNSNGLR